MEQSGNLPWRIYLEEKMALQERRDPVRMRNSYKMATWELQLYLNGPEFEVTGIPRGGYEPVIIDRDLLHDLPMDVEDSTLGLFGKMPFFTSVRARALRAADTQLSAETKTPLITKDNVRVLELILKHHSEGIPKGIGDYKIAQTIAEEFFDTHEICEQLPRLKTRLRRLRRQMGTKKFTKENVERTLAHMRARYAIYDRGADE